MGRSAYAPANAPGGARAASPGVCEVATGCLPPRAPTLQPNQPGLLQAHVNCGKLWKELAAPKQRKQTQTRPVVT